MWSQSGDHLPEVDVAITEINFFDHSIANLSHHGVQKFLARSSFQIFIQMENFSLRKRWIAKFLIRVLCSDSFVLIRIRVEIYQWIDSDDFNNSFTELNTQTSLFKKNLGERFIIIIEPLMKFLFSLSWALFVVARRTIKVSNKQLDVPL